MLKPKSQVYSSTKNQMNHLLIVGGTGMLKETTAHFIEQGDIVSIMGRNEDRLERFKKEYPTKRGRIWPIVQDYRDSEAALKKIQQAARMFMRIDVAILWIHDTGQKFSERVKRFLFLHNPSIKVYPLWGSSSIHPLELSKPDWRKKYPEQFREVFLGYHKNGAGSRWLTNHEISEGTIKAVEQDRQRYIIGALEPWKNRP